MGNLCMTGTPAQIPKHIKRRHIKNTMMPNEQLNRDDIHSWWISPQSIAWIDKFKVYGSSSKDQINGKCRLVDPEGNVIEGIFENGVSKQVYCYYAYMNFAKGQWKDYGLNGKGSIYNKVGEKIFEGELRNGKRQGKGFEYRQIDKAKLEGTWKNDKKNGYFTETLVINSKQHIISGNYTDDFKDGIFQVNVDGQDIESLQEQYTYGFLSYEDYQNYKKMKEQQEKTLPKQEPGRIRHGQLVTADEILELRVDIKMLNTAELSMFPRILFDHLQKKATKEKLTNRTMLFDTELVEMYGSFSYSKRNYKLVKHMTRHLQNSFSLVSGFYESIMFPMTSGGHFMLAVVKVRKPSIQGSPSQFYVELYDSIGGGSLYRIIDMLKRFLKDEYRHHFQKNDQRIQKAIENMQGRFMNSPRQYDGVSCGVFVCKYMYDLVVYNKIMDRHQYIKGFRNVIADLIQSPIDCFQEIQRRQKQGLYYSPGGNIGHRQTNKQQETIRRKIYIEKKPQTPMLVPQNIVQIPPNQSLFSQNISQSATYSQQIKPSPIIGQTKLHTSNLVAETTHQNKSLLASDPVIKLSQQQLHSPSFVPIQFNRHFSESANNEK